MTITEAGFYNISGTLTDGQIIVAADDAADDVTLILNGVNITNSDGSAIYVASANDTTITLAEGTSNYLTDGTTYNIGTDDVPDAALFSHDDLTINGTGSLTVTAHYNIGILSKDDLTIESGTINVTAVNYGIRGRDSVLITGGNITIDAGGDGIQSNNDEDIEKGVVTIEGGTIDITVENDGIQAETSLHIIETVI